MDPIDILISMGFHLDQSLGKNIGHRLAFTGGLLGETFAFDAEGDVWVSPSTRMLSAPFEYRPEIPLFGACAP
jgi:hypothetical protein